MTIIKQLNNRYARNFILFKEFRLMDEEGAYPLREIAEEH